MNTREILIKIIFCVIAIVLMAQLSGRSMANMTYVVTANTYQAEGLDLNVYCDIASQNDEIYYTKISCDAQSRADTCRGRILTYNSGGRDSSNLYTINSTDYAGRSRFWGNVFNYRYDNSSSHPVLTSDSDLNIVPAPGAILLGGIGISILSWFRRRGKF